MAHFSQAVPRVARYFPMTPSLKTLSLRYRAGMRRRLADRAQPSAVQAGRLGNEAQSLGLDIMDLARIHGEALLELMPLDGSEHARDIAVRHASGFFLDVLAPIERKRGASARSIAALKASNDNLHQRTGELTAANLRLKAEVVQRSLAERSLRLSEQKQSAMLEDAQHEVPGYDEIVRLKLDMCSAMGEFSSGILMLFLGIKLACSQF